MAISCKGYSGRRIWFWSSWRCPICMVASGACPLYGPFIIRVPVCWPSIGPYCTTGGGGDGEGAIETGPGVFSSCGTPRLHAPPPPIIPRSTGPRVCLRSTGMLNIGGRSLPTRPTVQRLTLGWGRGIVPSGGRHAGDCVIRRCAGMTPPMPPPPYRSFLPRWFGISRCTIEGGCIPTIGVEGSFGRDGSSAGPSFPRPNAGLKPMGSGVALGAETRICSAPPIPWAVSAFCGCAVACGPNSSSEHRSSIVRAYPRCAVAGFCMVKDVSVLGV